MSRPLYVNKIPPQYVEKTLARLLPAADIINKMSPDELYKLHHKTEDLKKLIRADPVRFYMPNPGGQWDFMTLDDPAIKVLLFIAGNKTGKTTGGAIKMAEFMTGRVLWGHDFRGPQQFKVPCYGCVFAEDFDSHKEVTLPTYLSWCPKQDIKTVVKNPAGSVTHIEHKNGSILFFRTYDQGSDKAEGKDWDIVWTDEPPPRAIYTAIMRGLVTLNGSFMITATLLKEAWLFEENDKPFVRMFKSSIDDNPWISAEAKQNFIDSLSDEEREIRMSGNPITLAGLVYKEFSERPPFLIPEQEFPNDWPVVMGVDPHERKPLHILWATITPDNTIIVFDWALIKGTTDSIQAELNAKESHHTMPAVLCVMDPNRGKAKQIDDKSWEDVFTDYGYPVMFTEDNIRIGHTMVHNYLMHRVEKVLVPRLRFTDACRGKGGPVHHMTRYAWEDWQKKRGNESKAIKEKPKDLYKDFPDIIRYMCLADLDFDTLKYGPRVIRRINLKETYSRSGVRAVL
jgi:phage terminase large subunit-like protein